MTNRLQEGEEQEEEEREREIREALMKVLQSWVRGFLIILI